MQGQPAMSTFTASTLSKLSEAYESPVYLSPACTPHGMTNKKKSKCITWSIPEYAHNTSSSIIWAQVLTKRRQKQRAPLHASWKLLQYSFLPKFLHHSCDGIGRTGWWGRCCIKALHLLEFKNVTSTNYCKTKTMSKLSLSTCLLATGLKAEQIRPTLESDPYYKGSKSSCIISYV